MNRTSGRSGWLAGLVVGAMAGFLSVEVPVFGLALFLAFAVVAGVVGPRLAALGGLLGATGGVALVLIALANARCAAFNGPGQGCSPPDLGPWIVGGGILTTLGAALTLAALAGSRRDPPGRA